MHTTNRTSTSEPAPEARSREPEARSREPGRGPVALMVAVAVTTLVWIAALVALARWLIASIL